MHILLVSNYFEPDAGAAAVRLTRLARLLQKRGHQLTVLTSLPHYPQGKIHEGYRRRWVVVENRDGVRVIQTWLFATPSPRISRKLLSQFTFMLTASLRGIALPKPDVIFIEGQPMPASLAGVFLAGIKQRPYVLNVSDLWPDHLLAVGAMTETSRVYRIARRLVDLTYRRAAAIVAMSPTWAERIQHHIGTSNKVQVILNGVDLNIFRPGIDTTTFRQKYELGTKKIISFIGTLATQYDFATMVAAVAKLKDRRDVQFVLIGRGSQRDIVQTLLSKTGLASVQWIDWIDQKEMPGAWNASYITFWAIGKHELYQGTIPAKLYEALACGIPVVAATQGVTATIIRESGAGIAVGTEDIDGLAAALQRFLVDTTYRDQCSQAARHYAETHYDPEQVAMRYAQVLSAAANGQNG